MSRALYSWYSLPDLMALADRGAVLEGTIELERFSRLLDLLNSSEGSARARISLRRGHDDMLLMELQCDAALELVCQRCLEPVVHQVSGPVEFVVAETEGSISQLPEGVELIVLEGDRFQPAKLIEDELIVSLPLVPRHGDENHAGEN
jgi:DUF177 domain-containing protein